jgi:hypothetical protein
MFDPQTSGGLLLSVPQGAVDVFEAALSVRGGESWTIGRVVDKGDRDVVLA